MKWSYNKDNLESYGPACILNLKLPLHIGRCSFNKYVALHLDYNLIILSHVQIAEAS